MWRIRHAAISMMFLSVATLAGRCAEWCGYCVAATELEQRAGRPGGGRSLKCWTAEWWLLTHG